MTLERDPNVALEEARLDSARGALQVQSGRFDPVVSSSVAGDEIDDPLTPSSSSETRSVASSLGVVKEFRSGLTIEPGFELLRVEDLGAGEAPVNQGTLTFRVRQPLLRGRGRETVTAGERSAERELAASGLDLRHTVSLRILTVASQYWTAKAALLNLDILRETEESSRELLETTRTLIEADQVPAAELVQLEANLAAKESARIGGERSLFAARQDLGREIGLDRIEIAALPLPGDPFPSVRPDRVPPVAEADRFVAEALRRRADLAAAREREEALDILARAAENALKPRLDLLFTPSYSGLAEGRDAADFFSPLYRNVPGLSSSLSFSLLWPTTNNQARGALLQAEASQRQSGLVIELLTKGIGADVPAALDAVGRNALQLAKAREAVLLFERAVVNEEKKLRAGSSTLLDLISQRDRLTAAQQTMVSAELALALSLLELRFQTGTLLGEAGEPALPLEEVRTP